MIKSGERLHQENQIGSGWADEGGECLRLGRSMRKSLGQEQTWGVQNREGTSWTGRAHVFGKQEGKAGRLG